MENRFGILKYLQILVEILVVDYERKFKIIFVVKMFKISRSVLKSWNFKNISKFSYFFFKLWKLKKIYTYMAENIKNILKKFQKKFQKTFHTI